MTAGDEPSIELVHPAGWPAPKGYANGAAAQGRVVFVSGQVGWDPFTERIASHDFAVQAGQALRNVAAVLAAARAEPRHVTRLTWFVTDKGAYVAARRELGRAYREVFGRHYPAMSVVFVSALLEDGALVEIEATAVVP